jgi:hypothetical protein
MQFPELRQVTSDMIRQAYRIHQAMLGDSTDVNRANAQTAEEVHVSWHEVPRLRRQRDALNNPYLECFGDTAKGVEFDFDDPFPASADEINDELTVKSKAAQVLVEAGWDPDDVLQMVGIPKMKFVGPPTAPAIGNPPPVKRPALPRQTSVETPDFPQPPGQQPQDHYMYDLGEMVREAFAEVKTNGNGHKKEGELV